MREAGRGALYGLSTGILTLVLTGLAAPAETDAGHAVGRFDMEAKTVL